MTIGSIGWIELPGKDCAVTAAFYERAFGWKVHEDAPGYFVFDDGAGNTGAFRGDLQPSSTGPILYLTVPTIEEGLRRVEEAGGTTVTGKTLIHESIGWWALFIDPAGSLIGIWQRAT